jgi:hypothetical protein
MGLGLAPVAERPVISAAYSAEATALFAAMTVQPDAARKTLIDNLIVSLKSAGVWAKLDFLYVLAAHDAQAARLNWLTAANLATVNGTTTFTTDRGYKGDGSTGWLDTGYLWNGLTKYIQNDACLGIWVTSNVIEAAGPLIGMTTTNRAQIVPRSTSTTCNVRINTGTGSNQTTSTARGHTLGNRSGSASYDIYKDASLLGSPANVSALLVAEAVAFLRHQTNFSSLNTLSAAHAGSNLTATEITNLSNALSTFMTAIGA